MFVGEAPGYEEDIQGEPFVGKAGRLLTQTLKELGISRDQVYIANIVKCRPPENREPRLAEIVACLPYLLRQIEFIKPKVICALGRISAQTLLSTQTPMSQLRGRFHEHNNMRIFPAFHPAYILRNPSDHKIYKNDIKRVCKEAGLIE
jgi:DNA polymerase